MTTFYTFTLLLHSWNRWLIVIAGVFILASAILGISGKSDFSASQRKWSLVFISSLHLQLLAGLLLYFVLSPITANALSNFGAAMKDADLRYWAVEHAFVNILAIAAAQTGSILVKRSENSLVKHKRTLIWTGIAFVLILVMIPLGILGPERPWFRF